MLLLELYPLLLGHYGRSSFSGSWAILAAGPILVEFGVIEMLVTLDLAGLALTIRQLVPILA